MWQPPDPPTTHRTSGQTSDSVHQVSDSSSGRARDRKWQHPSGIALGSDLEDRLTGEVRGHCANGKAGGRGASSLRAVWGAEPDGPELAGSKWALRPSSSFWNGSEVRCSGKGS